MTLTRVARIEFAVLISVLVMFLMLLYPSLRHARREVRDGIRRTEVREVKVALEQHFNEHERYPLEFDASPHEYVVVEAANDGAVAWYVRAELENAAAAEAGFDDEYNIYFRVVQEDGRTFYDICGGELRALSCA